jgi:hypothetical protein
VHTHTYIHIHILQLISFMFSDDGSVVNNVGLMLHLQSEFADLKSTHILQDLSWRTWWSLKKERFKYLYPVVQTLLSLAPTEAAGKTVTNIHTRAHTHKHKHIDTHTHTQTHMHIHN